MTDHKFTPGLTSYYHRIQVQTYDVTELLHEGENIWQTIVGDGWWRWNNNFGYQLALWGQLELIYADGSVDTIGTDESFEVGTGPVVKTDLQKGETYDARIVPSHWTKAIAETEHTDAMRIPQQGVPVREKERFAGKLLRDSAGNLVADFGQNIAGYVHMVLHDTKPGQIIHLKHGEGLDKEGKFSTANCDGGMAEFQEITFICKGGKKEELFLVDEFNKKYQLLLSKRLLFKSFKKQQELLVLQALKNGTVNSTPSGAITFTG